MAVHRPVSMVCTNGKWPVFIALHQAQWTPKHLALHSVIHKLIHMLTSDGFWSALPTSSSAQSAKRFSDFDGNPELKLVIR